MKDTEKQDIKDDPSLSDQEFWRTIEERNKNIPNWKLYGFSSASEYADYREIVTSSVESDNITNSW